VVKHQKWFMLVAAVLMLLVVGLELGSSLFLSTTPPNELAARAAMTEEGVTGDEQDEAIRQLLSSGFAPDDPPGLAIPALAAIDGLLMLSIVGLAAALVVPHRVTAKVVAPVNLVVSIIVIILAIIGIVITITLIFLMIGLFLAIPFGTITYVVRWGFFPRGDAQLLLGILLGLKVFFVIALFLAAPRMAKDKGLVGMVATSLLLQLLVGFLHGIVPLTLVSILDAIAAVIILIVAVIWAIIILVGSLIGTIRLIPTGSSS